ncbi:RTA1 like protein-domain-containing protein [Lipomyces kononenkoae]|uniref:RTA1 like protein-domain-containing protein n=1 Tax=Lipomyces kononenkoae TaxID=34357 RepID=A0ACC3T713_LIPKO
MAVILPVAGTTVYLWKYIPSLAASAVFAILFFVATCLIGFRMYKTKTWFCTAFVIGCFMEIIGYCGRAFCVYMTDQVAPYIIQATFILLPPAFFAATIYMILARIIRLVDGDHLSVVKPQIVTALFVTGDILSLVVQSLGSPFFAHDNLRTVATTLVIVGLAIQLISFTFFAVCAIIFHMRFRRNPTARSYQVDPKWVQTLYMLYAISVLIVIRSVFRIVEYVFGQDGYPISHEWTLYSFDSVPMISVTIIFFVHYPTNFAPKPGDDAACQLESQATWLSETI